MGDTWIIVISIILAVLLMFVFPMLHMSSNQDEITQVVIQSETAEYVATISSTGKITVEEYDKFEQQIYATGNTYDIEFEVQIPDGNPAKKTTTVTATKTGEQEYYSVFTTDIMNVLEKGEDYTLPKGAIVTVTVKNSNQTLFQTFQAFLYQTTSDTYQIAAQQSAVVGTSGE